MPACSPGRCSRAQPLMSVSVSRPSAPRTTYSMGLPCWLVKEIFLESCAPAHRGGGDGEQPSADPAPGRAAGRSGPAAAFVCDPVCFPLFYNRLRKKTRSIKMRARKEIVSAGQCCILNVSGGGESPRRIAVRFYLGGIGHEKAPCCPCPANRPASSAPWKLWYGRRGRSGPAAAASASACWRSSIRREWR